MVERQKSILEQLAEEQRIEVSTLAERLGVSQVTMRKDLDQLEKRGLIKREHGFAFIGSSDDLNNRLAYHYEEKCRIARLAAKSVQPGETVMIESGSCCALLADELSKTLREVTIITNSAFIAGYIRSAPHTRVVLLGGDYQPEAQVMIGPLTRMCAESFFVDKLFIGTDGFAPGYGFTAGDMMRAEAVHAMRKQAGRAIILTESIKFSQQGVVSLLPFGEVNAIYTDENIPDDAATILSDHGIELYKA